MSTSALKKANMMEGPLWLPVLLFALPLAATGILQQLFNAADIAVVGNFTGELGAVCMAAVGASAPVINLILNLFIGMSLGSNVVVARAIGAKEPEVVTKAIGTSITFALAAGIGASILGEIFCVQILELIGVPEEVMSMASLYLRIYMAGMPVILLYNFEAALFRGAGNTKVPLIVLTCAGCINVGLNLIFVIFLHMAVEGVAIATVSSNVFSAVVLFILLKKGMSGLKLEMKYLKLDLQILRGILAIGLPAGLQGAVFAVANIIVQTAFNALGTMVMAASSAAITIEATTFNILNSFSQACVTFTGQNYGAGNFARCKKVLKVCLIEDFICVFTIAMSIIFFGRNLLLLFNSDPQVIALGYSRIVVLCLSHCCSLFYECISGYLRGFGISMLPFILAVIGICGIRIFWVFVIFPMNPTFMTVILVYPISLVTTSLMMAGALIILRPAAKMEGQSRTRLAMAV